MLTDVKVAHWFSLWTKPGGIDWDASYLEHDSWLWKRLHTFTLWCWPVPDPNDLNLFSFLPIWLFLFTVVTLFNGNNIIVNALN